MTTMSRRLMAVANCLFMVSVCGSPLVVVASDYSQAVISRTKPVLYWEFNESCGPAKDLAPDLAGRSNTGSYENATRGGPGPRPCDGLTKMDLGNAATSVNRTGAIRFVQPRTAAHVPVDRYSVQCWFQSTTAFHSDAVHTVLGRGNSNGEARDTVGVGGTLNLTQLGRMYFYEPASGKIFSGSRTIDPDTWYHVLFVRNGRSVKVYLNGRVEIDADVGPWPGGDGEQLTIGNRADYAVKRYAFGLAGWSTRWRSGTGRWNPAR